ncbi:MAG: PEP-CTERM sorting domain-containing protein [Bryobacterales bacterium]|nr:PEP-CTERM sorting domain-containing protein [Bryobacterales bacterium]
MGHIPASMLHITLTCCAFVAPMFGATILNTTGSVTLSSAALQFGASAPSTGVYTGLNGTSVSAQFLPFAAPVPQFLSFVANPSQTVNLNSISPGVSGAPSCAAAAASGQTCSPPGIPLNFINTNQGAAVQFTVTGTAVNNATGGQTPITGVYTLQAAGVSYQQLLADFNSGKTLQTTYSAEFSSTAGAFHLSGGVSLSNTGIAFSQSQIAATAPGAFLVGPFGAGDFSPLAGTNGHTLDLGLLATNVANFLTFAADPGLSITLASLHDGAGSAAICFDPASPGQLCSPNLPGLSRLTFFNSASGAMVVFTMSGELHRLNSPTSTPVRGIYTTQFIGLTYQQLLDQVYLNGVPVTGQYSASFTTGDSAVPEPATALLLCMGLAVIACSRRHQLSRRKSGTPPGDAPSPMA